MKIKEPKVELNVDFIGNQEPLTKEEEIKLNDYFSKIKKSRKKNKSKEKVLA